MRAITFLFLSALLTGTATMTDTATADEPKKKVDPEAKSPGKKDEPKELKEGDRTYTEKVTLRAYLPNQKVYMKAMPGLWALRKDTEDGLMFDIRGIPVLPDAVKDSIIIDAAGNEYTIWRAYGPPNGLFVKLTKEAPKKPAEKKP